MRTDRTDAPRKLSPDSAWQPLSPGRARALTDARLQFHHAAQLAAAVARSFLPPEPDNRHTNLEWIAEAEMLASRMIPAPTPFRVAVRPADLTLHLLDADGGALASLPLDGVTLEDAAVSLAATTRMMGADVDRFTIARPYQIPAHPVMGGAPFDAGRADDFAELSDWFSDADALLRELAAGTPGAGEVRCWPHHFDISTLLAIGATAARGIGVGMNPGDDVYPEPYFYVSLNPAPRADGATLPALAGSGRWHILGWVGAVLPGSRLTPEAAGQRDQVDAFVRSAIDACRGAAGG